MTATYDAADRLTSVAFTATAEACALSYDANGNLARKDCGLGKVSDYSWDGLNRLVGIAAPGVVASFTYDPTGRRTSRVVNGVITTFVYDDAQVLGEYSPAGLTSLLNGLGIDELIAAYSSTRRRIAITDAQDTVLAEVRPDGSVEGVMGYSAYGESNPSPGGRMTSIAFTGRENDETGLLFYRARYYDPVLKRFTSEDPIGLSGGLNRFAYVKGDPVLRLDPFGLASKQPNYLPPAARSTFPRTYSPRPPRLTMPITTSDMHGGIVGQFQDLTLSAINNFGAIQMNRQLDAAMSSVDALNDCGKGVLVVLMVYESTNILNDIAPTDPVLPGSVFIGGTGSSMQEAMKDYQAYGSTYGTISATPPTGYRKREFYEFFPSNVKSCGVCGR